MRAVNTRTWSADRIKPYVSAILEKFGKLAARFPADVTVENLARECDEGVKDLWLVLDDDDRLKLVGATQLRTVDATGTRIATLMDLAGEDVASCADEICTSMEAWAKEQGADFVAVEGRPGWGREMKKRGYREYAVLWRKTVA